MMGIAVGITWAVLAVYLFGSLPVASRLESEPAEAEEPINVMVTDLRRSDSRDSAARSRAGRTELYDPERTHDHHRGHAHDSTHEHSDHEHDHDGDHGDEDGGERETTFAEGMTVAAMT